MRRLFLLPVLLLASVLVIGAMLWPAQAEAQQTTLRASLPKCIPLVNGYPLGIQIAESDNYLHVYLLCRDRGDTRSYFEGVSCNKQTTCSYVQFFKSALTVHYASAKVSTAHSEYRKSVKFDCRDVVKEQTDRGRMCRERYDILAANLTEWFPQVPAGTPPRKTF